MKSTEELVYTMITETEMTLRWPQYFMIRTANGSLVSFDKALLKQVVKDSKLKFIEQTGNRKRYKLIKN